MSDRAVNPDGKKGLKKEEGQGSKKPYQPPAWEVEEVFESHSLQITCGKNNDNDCSGGPVQS